MNNMKTILVTGGAGYIGSVAVKKLCNLNHEVIVIDNLSKGMKELVDSRAVFYERDLKENLEDIFSLHKIDAIIHFAGYKSVEESMFNGIKYSDNLTGGINLLNCAIKYKISRFVFSSTAAVYGESSEKLGENATLNPINFYGFTKLTFEKILKWYNRIYGLSYVSLRYFNVAGDVLGYIDPDAKNIFPIIMNVITKKSPTFFIFGNDYETRDKTCIRDYVHIEDLVDAHVLVLNNSFVGPLNIGSGEGFSVLELIQMFKEVSGIDFSVTVSERRKGDSATLCANISKAKSLGYSPKHSLKEMIESTLKSYK
jgi:UDP-glucose 4-epimerase